VNRLILSIEDVNNTFVEHKGYLDKLWPEGGERLRKDEVLDIIDGIKARLHQKATNNLNRTSNAFEAAARRATNSEEKLEDDYEKPKAEKEYESMKDRINRIKNMNRE
jgi:hypothetical protein